MRHERLNPLGGFFGSYRAKRHRRDHQTAHDRLGDLFAKILPKVPSGLAFLAFHIGRRNQFCSTHFIKRVLKGKFVHTKNPDHVELDLPVQLFAKIKKQVDLGCMPYPNYLCAVRSSGRQSRTRMPKHQAKKEPPASVTDGRRFWKHGFDLRYASDEERHSISESMVNDKATIGVMAIRKNT